MTDKKVTINSLLNEDTRKHLAELLLNNDVTNMVVIYRKENDLLCESSEEAIATTLGMIEMAKTLVIDDWLHSGIHHPEICEDEDQYSEEEAS